MRVTLVISSLGSGGAERVMSILANYWAERQWDVTLITIDGVSSDFYQLNPNIKRIGLGLMTNSDGMFEALRRNVRGIRMLRKALLEAAPEVVISFVDKMNIVTILALVGSNIPVIISERVDPSLYRIGGIWSFLRRRTYPVADAIVVQSENAGRWIDENITCGKTSIIPNPVFPGSANDEDASSLRSLLMVPHESRIVVAMGRLCRQKGFDLLLEAFAGLARDFPCWHLVIFGEGEDRVLLEGLAVRLGIGDRVRFPGTVYAPHSLLRQGDLFVMSSRFEGFPNALCEAMACGLPVVSFDCPSGPGEIIRDGIDGFLVPPEDVQSLAETMKILMEDEDLAIRISSRAPDILERFGLDTVANRWHLLINNVKKGN